MSGQNVRVRSTVVWEDADTATYTADTTVINGHVVSVCLDDEGPMSPAYYWDIDNRTHDGWETSVAKARRAAVKFARGLDPL